MYFGNLPWSIKWQGLKDMCKEYGFIKRADVSEFKGSSKGYGIVDFSTPAAAQRCIDDLNGSELDGRELIVRLDNSPSSAKVYLGNIPWDFKWQGLKDKCKSFGWVVRATVPEKKGFKAGESKGFGIIQFSNRFEAAKCIKALDGKSLGGRRITARFDKYSSPAQ